MSDDDWETDADFVNDISEEEQRRAGSKLALQGLNSHEKATTPGAPS